MLEFTTNGNLYIHDDGGVNTVYFRHLLFYIMKSFRFVMDNPSLDYKYIYLYWFLVNSFGNPKHSELDLAWNCFPAEYWKSSLQMACLLPYPSFLLLPSLCSFFLLFLTLHSGDIAIFTEQMFPYVGTIPAGNTVIYSRNHQFGLKVQGDGKLCLYNLRYVGEGEERGRGGRADLQPGRSYLEGRRRASRHHLTVFYRTAMETHTGVMSLLHPEVAHTPWPSMVEQYVWWKPLRRSGAHKQPLQYACESTMTAPSSW